MKLSGSFTALRGNLNDCLKDADSEWVKPLPHKIGAEAWKMPLLLRSPKQQYQPDYRSSPTAYQKPQGFIGGRAGKQTGKVRAERIGCPYPVKHQGCAHGDKESAHGLIHRAFLPEMIRTKNSTKATTIRI